MPTSRASCISSVLGVKPDMPTIGGRSTMAAAARSSAVLGGVTAIRPWAAVHACRHSGSHNPHARIAKPRDPSPAIRSVLFEAQTGAGAMLKWFKGPCHPGHTSAHRSRSRTIAPPIRVRRLRDASPLAGRPQRERRCTRLQPALAARWQHLRVGSVVRTTGLMRNRAQRKSVERAQQVLTKYDILTTPMLATMPPKAICWREQALEPNALRAVWPTCFLGTSDLSGFPAMSMSVGIKPVRRSHRSLILWRHRRVSEAT